MTTHKKSFKDFNNKFSLTRTLRFELVPDEKTKKFLNFDANNLQEIFPQERKRKEAREYIKKCWDKLIMEFINRALSNIKLDDSLLKKAYELEKKILSLNKKDKKRSEKIKEKRELYKKLRKEITRELDKYILEIDDNEVTKKVLLSKDVIPILKEEFKNEKESEENFNAFDNMFTVLGDLMKNKEHYFGFDGKHGQIATRIIDENLDKFLKNVFLFEKHKDKFEELNLSDEQKQIFNLDYYNNLLTQKGIDKYNAILTGDSENKGGINKEINELNQKNKDGKLPLFQTLFNQIGSEKELLFESIESDEELYNLLSSFDKESIRLYEDVKSFYEFFFNSITKDEFDLNKIYLSKRAVRAISQEILSSWEALNNVFVVKKGKKQETLKYVSLSQVKDFIEEGGDYLMNLEGGIGISWDNFLSAWKKNIFAVINGGEVKSVVSDVSKKEFASLSNLKSGFDNFLLVLDRKIKGEKVNKNEWQKAVDGLRLYLEEVIELVRIVKLFNVTYKKGKKVVNALTDEIQEDEKDEKFYSEFDFIASRINNINPHKLFNKVRNYLTKKNEKANEIRIYLHPGFLGGWSENKIKDSKGIFVKDKEGFVHLVILNDKFDIHTVLNDDKNGYLVYIINSMGDPSKDIPNLFLIDGKTERRTGRRDKKTGENKILEEIRNKYLPKEINEIRLKYGYGSDVNRENLGDKLDLFINYYKDRLKEKYARELSFKFKEKYDSYLEFVEDVKKQAYSVRKLYISENVFDSLVERGVLLKFKIHNKDLSRLDKTTRKNIHTLIFNSLFSDENLDNPPVKIRLGGSAKIFLRDPVLKQKEIKIDSQGKEIYVDGSPVYAKRRFLDKKLLFHFPVQINGHITKKVTDKDLSVDVNKELLNVKRPVLGIDRGERHLLYWCLIDGNGNKEGGSLNKINGVNYLELLKEREEERERSRKEWKEIESIKKLKEGYLSHVIHFIVSKAIKNNAIIVLEDLSFRFIQKRGGKFERTVYQQFQKALLNKLEIVIDKEKETIIDSPQLVCTNAGRGSISLQDLNGQHGIVFFLEPSYTSQTCPECGWRKDIYIHFKTDIDDLIEDFSNRYSSIVFDGKRFIFEYKKENDGSSIKIYSDVDRIYWDRSKRKNIEFQGDDLTALLYSLFNDNSDNSEKNVFKKAKGFEINIKEEKNFLDELLERVGDDYKKSWQALIYYLNRILDIRNSYKTGKEDEVDFLQCPRCKFDTRKEKSFLKNGDAVGAYNVARKGIIALKEISQNPEETKIKIDKHKWDQFIFKKI